MRLGEHQTLALGCRNRVAELSRRVDPKADRRFDAVEGSHLGVAVRAAAPKLGNLRDVHAVVVAPVDDHLVLVHSFPLQIVAKDRLADLPHLVGLRLAAVALNVYQIAGTLGRHIVVGRLELEVALNVYQIADTLPSEDVAAATDRSAKPCRNNHEPSSAKPIWRLSFR